MVLPLRVLLEDKSLNLEALHVALKSFSCERDSDVQSFLHSKAIEYESKNKARTYLIIDDNSQELVIRGYFSLALKVFEFKSTNTKQCKIDMGKGQNASKPAYLIGQLAKNDFVNESSVFEEFLVYVFEKIKMAQNYVGGRIIYLDCKESLEQLYSRVGFQKATDRADESGYLQMYKIV